MVVRTGSPRWPASEQKMSRVSNKSWQSKRIRNGDEVEELCGEYSVRVAGQRSDGARGGRCEVYTYAAKPSPHLTPGALAGHPTVRLDCLSATMDSIALLEGTDIEIRRFEAQLHDLRISGENWHASRTKARAASERTCCRAPIAPYYDLSLFKSSLEAVETGCIVLQKSLVFDLVVTNQWPVVGRQLYPQLSTVLTFILALIAVPFFTYEGYYWPLFGERRARTPFHGALCCQGPPKSHLRRAATRAERSVSIQALPSPEALNVCNYQARTLRTVNG